MKKIIFLPVFMGASLLLAGVNIQTMPNIAQRAGATNKNIILSYNGSIKDIKKVL